MFVCFYIDYRLSEDDFIQEITRPKEVASKHPLSMLSAAKKPKFMEGGQKVSAAKRVVSGFLDDLVLGFKRVAETAASEADHMHKVVSEMECAMLEQMRVATDAANEALLCLDEGLSEGSVSPETFLAGLRENALYFDITFCEEFLRCFVYCAVSYQVNVYNSPVRR